MAVPARDPTTLGSRDRTRTRTAGFRSWLDTATGAAKLWLHPSDWPETTHGQTNRVVVAGLVAVTATATLLLRAAGPASLTAHIADPVTTVWLVPILAGLALAIPLPPLRPSAIASLVATALRSLAAPAVALVALFLIAHSGVADHSGGWVHVVQVAYYWVTLTFVAVRLCTATARIGRIANLPSTRRLRVAFLFVGGGFAVAAAQALIAISGETVVVSYAFAALAAVVLVAAADLGRVSRS